MLKTKLRILLSIFLVLIVVSSYCLATDELGTQVQEEVNQLVEAQSEVQDEEQEGEELDWTNTDLYLAQDTVTISNVVDGNAFVIADEVVVTGEIGGDLFVIANKLTIEGGYVYSSIFTCAKEITMNGVVYDIYAISNDINIGKNGFVYRDLKAVTSQIKIEGTIRRDAYISSSNIQFGEEEQSYIGGNLHYTSNNQIEIPETAVGGEVKYTAANSTTNKTIANTILSYVKDFVQTIFFTFIIALILLWLTPKFIERVGTMGVAKAFASLGIGFAAPIAFGIIALLLALSTVGVSLVVCGTFVAVILAYISFSIVSIFFGKLLAKLLKVEGKIKFVLLTLLTSVILWIISQIPIIGGIFSFLICLFGIGTTLVNVVYREEEKIEK